GTRVALAICEDLWARDPAFGRRLYGREPQREYEAGKPQLVISVSASPYLWAKLRHREELHAEIARSLGCPLVYVNQVGATDEILFDGASFAMEASGKIAGRLPVFKSAFGLVEISGGKVTFEKGSVVENEAPSDLEILHRALVVGIREYFTRTGFKTAILGLSGGIDSAVVAALAVEALGPRNVMGIGMPSQFSSGHSLTDAEALAANLGMPFEVRPIKLLYPQANREISERRGTLTDLAQENLQSRLRGLIL